MLARILDTTLPDDLIDGWVIEAPLAGGHSAPPRSKQYDEEGHPIYDKRDEANLETIRELGKPFFLSGGYGSPEGL